MNDKTDQGVPVVPLSNELLNLLPADMLTDLYSVSSSLRDVASYAVGAVMMYHLPKGSFVRWDSVDQCYRCWIVDEYEEVLASGFGPTKPAAIADAAERYYRGLASVKASGD